MTDFRTERDSMGEVQVPSSAYYGAQTQRAVENFPISGGTIDGRLVRALALIKGSAATVNATLAEVPAVDDRLATAIRAAARFIFFAVKVDHTIATASRFNINFCFVKIHLTKPLF